jgi:hypothetical protein
MIIMPQYEYSKEYMEYTWQYREYLAVRDMCRMIIALHQEDFDTAAEVWNKHEGPHYRLTTHSINAFISYLAHNGQDPAEWARGYSAHMGSQNAAARDMCRMMIALYQEDDDTALSVWNEYDGTRDHIRLAMQAMDALIAYYMRDGKDPAEWARGYEAFAAGQAGTQPSLTEEKESTIAANNICAHSLSSHMEFGDIRVKGDPPYQYREFWHVTTCAKCGKETHREADEYYGDDMADIHWKWSR